MWLGGSNTYKGKTDYNRGISTQSGLSAINNKLLLVLSLSYYASFSMLPQALLFVDLAIAYVVIILLLIVDRADKQCSLSSALTTSSSAYATLVYCKTHTTQSQEHQNLISSTTCSIAMQMEEEVQRDALSNMSEAQQNRPLKT